LSVIYLCKNEDSSLDRTKEPAPLISAA